VKQLFILLLIVGCLPEQQASLVAKKISDSTAKYCDPIKMNACVLKFIKKKQREYSKVSVVSEDKALAGELVCPIISKAFSLWLINGKLSTKCGCDRSENSELLSEKIKSSCISASPY
jgi:hypothetical protein